MHSSLAFMTVRLSADYLVNTLILKSLWTFFSVMRLCDAHCFVNSSLEASGPLGTLPVLVMVQILKTLLPVLIGNY